MQTIIRFFIFFFLVQNLNAADIILGNTRLDRYLPLLKNKKVALVVNQTSKINNTHLIDTLLKSNVKITVLFALEHGIRGTADAGEELKNGIDAKTKIPIISLYGNNKKPTAQHLKNVDVIVYDIQDVGVRFYTYISSLHYILESCVENNKKCIILDRPNPNGDYVDGPVLEKKLASFVGMHPVPVVYGLTCGEYGKMIFGEQWVKMNLKTSEILEVVPCLNYTHKTSYSLPVRPSPNLPNDLAIRLYPSLCFFEGTNVSVGRGTKTPFQVFGSPSFIKDSTKFQFKPTSTVGAKTPLYQDSVCYAVDLSKLKSNQKFTLKYLLTAYNYTSDKEKFFLKNNFFDKLIGNSKIKEMIRSNTSEKEIVQSYKADIEQYKTKRKKYLLYKDFE